LIQETNTGSGLIASTVDAHLRYEREQEGKRPTAFGTALRGSQAYNCARKIGFEMAQVNESEELPYETLIAFHLGQAMHEKVQQSLTAMWEDFEAEAPVDLRPFGYDISGHADGLFTIGDKKYVLELKTMTAFPFKLALKGDGTTTDSPKIEHILQAGIYAYGLEADGIQIVYVSKDASYRDGVKPGMTLEFRFDMDDVVPSVNTTVRELVEQELSRLKVISEEVESGMIPPRFVPDEGWIEDPPRYAASKGYWRCRYCVFNIDCRALPTQAVPVEASTPNIQNSWDPPATEFNEHISFYTSLDDATEEEAK
tara:strand:+ start:6919 stop:7854 length:936 start_codon:yes stop_codon:yes gene_type:complete